MADERKDILRYALILFAITAVVAGLLAGVNLLTKDTITQNEVAAEQEALREVMPEAASFEALDAETAALYGVDAVYTAAGADGAAQGYCVKVSENGYGGVIQAVAGVDAAGRVTGVSIISHSETPGLGANIEKESFRKQYTGQGAVDVVKAGAQEGEVNAVSGATISSKALTAGVNKAVEVAAQLQSGAPPTPETPEGEEAGTDE